MAYHALLDFGCSAFLSLFFFFYQCAPPTDLCNSENGGETKASTRIEKLLYALGNIVKAMQYQSD